MKTDLHITIVGMGLIGASLYKAANHAGYGVNGIDKGDAVELSHTDILLVALPPEVIPAWLKEHACQLQEGAIVVDTCGVKVNICRELEQLMPPGCIFVGGHPMAGKEMSGQAYADAKIFRGASMILTPNASVPEAVIGQLKEFFSSLGFAQVLVATPEHHDEMIAFTSQLGHIIAATYTQDELAGISAGYTAGSYANMTRIASMNPDVWTTLFSENREWLLPVVDRFLERMSTFRNALAEDNHSAMREYIAAGASAKAQDGVQRMQPRDANDAVPTLGHHLKLRVFGSSHAPAIGMEMENFPRGFRVDGEELQAFMERRAPGRDEFSTKRREADVPVFRAGIADGITTGETILSVIENTDCRPGDYKKTSTIPRPSHADFTQWIQTGRIPTGGGNHSGRMTAPLCIAGGICLQWLKSRGITISSRLVSAGGNSADPESEIRTARLDGDSVGGIIEVTVSGLPCGIGGAMFKGVESWLSAAIFSIPGVKGFEIGDGFALAGMRGSQANDAFVMDGDSIVTTTNRHGGLLGGITTGMPVVFRLAIKPTPSIYKPQESVDLEIRQNAVCQVQGRHDPCIARRAMPVAEALAAFTFADLLLADETVRPRICLTLTEGTIAENLAVLAKNYPFFDMCELRVDCLAPEEFAEVKYFPAQAKVPVILTARRPEDGGQWHGTEEERTALLLRALSDSPRPFAFVDMESDFRVAELEDVAKVRGTRIIRSLHKFDGPVENIVECATALKGTSDDIPKIACKVNHCADLERIFRQTAQFTGFPHIVCAMGIIGQASRILAERTHSMLTFASPAHALEKMGAIGHLSPEILVERYGFRSLTSHTELFGVTGWPLEHSRSPELNNAAFFAEAKDAVMVPLPAETAEEALRCAETLGIHGIAVTIPHKKAMIPLMASLTPEAEAVGAVNTVIKTVSGWIGANTDIVGFRKSLLCFLGAESLKGRKVAIIGAGGAATAVAYVIDQLGADACIFNKTLARAEDLAAKYGFKSAVLGPESLDLLKEYGEIIIQATSVGLSSGDSQGDDPIPFYDFQGHEQIFDLIYSPEETPVMARARKSGCRAENGLGMLIEQAREQRRLYAAFN